MKRLKTCFGHALHPDNQDQEDPYIPVYNIIFDRYWVKIILDLDNYSSLEMISGSLKFGHLPMDYYYNL